MRFASSQQIRDEIARAVPLYAGIERLRAQGDQFQWGGPRLFADGVFDTPDGKARFTAVTPPARRAPDGDVLRLHAPRQAVQLHGAARDGPAQRRAPRGRADVAPRTPTAWACATAIRCGWPRAPGGYVGRARIEEMKPGNLEVHWPEGNVLLCREEIDLASHEPDYNAIVAMERA